MLAFATFEGLYQPTRLPFGLKTSPQIYERAISQVLQRHGLDCVAHYFDDFIIYSNTLEEHQNHLRQFFAFCEAEKLQLNFAKCEFFKQSINFLGYTITAGTITPLTRNTDIIHAIKQPHNRKTLQSFLGAVNVYNKFIPEYARLRAPLNNLLKKDVVWNWNEACQEAFIDLKGNLTQHPILHLYKEGLPCQVYCDASTLGIAGILKQVHPDGNVYPVQYFSRTLRPHEKNYSISELECLAIVESVEKFRIYLMGRKFTIFSDHHALQWLKTIKNPSGRLFRWSLRLSSYEYEVRYIKGKLQYEADLLSRNPFCGFLDATLIKTHQSPPSKESSLTIDHNGLHTVSRKGVTKIILPKPLIQQLLQTVHTQYNHPGISQMSRIISTQYYWQGMSKDIKQKVKTCPTCQLTKRPVGPTYGELSQPPESKEPFDLLSLDTIVGFAKYGNTKIYLHVVVDHFSRYAWAFPSKSTSTTTYQQVLKRVFQDGSPKRLLTDRAPAFTSPKFRSFLLNRNIHPLLTTSNNPQANGLCERLNATLTGKLRLLHLENPKVAWTKLSKFDSLYRSLTNTTLSYCNERLWSDGKMMQGQLLAIMSGMLRLESRDFVDIFQEEACTAIKTTIKQTVIEALAEVDDLDQETYSCNKNLFVKDLVTEPKCLLGRRFLLLESSAVVVVVSKKSLRCLHASLSQQQQCPLSWFRTDRTRCVAQDVRPNAATLLPHLAVSPESGLPQHYAAPAQDRDQRMTCQLCSSSEESPSILLLGDCLNKLLTDICNHAHNRCARLLSSRIKNQLQAEEVAAENGSPPDKFCSGEFIQLVQRVETFSTDCENICGRRSPALRLALQTHANKFVTRFHEERKTKLGLILENEEWKQSDVPAQFQHLVDHIKQTGLISMPSDRTPNRTDTQKCLVVDGEKFTVVGGCGMCRSVLLVLEMMVEYCQCALDVPMVAPDLLTRLLDFLKVQYRGHKLSLFNSRTCQLVLGAQAIRVVRVITARHLALTSRSLQLIAHYLPLLQHTFQHHLLAPRYHAMCHHFSDLIKKCIVITSPMRYLSSVLCVVQNFENHVHLIASKLVTITEVMFESHLSKWEAKPPVPSSSFQAILRQLIKVHAAVADCLPPEQVNALFTTLHGCFKSRLKHHLCRLKVSADGGPQQGLVNLELAMYMGKLQNLKVYIDTSSSTTDDLWTTSS
ncbi:hypothetical protein LAZ67_16000896 [Cordylochernes scorpioides]|uniref:RNA-directed DNA polymerase n=1 Tax=Cordylochernes scorpioides TaxID=51811 RepID=A0ABY6LFP6_9ARAC|nr:hypothetical protein LAZ67_16000896 [Cordylochernes scorpioides]